MLSLFNFLLGVFFSFLVVLLCVSSQFRVVLWVLQQRKKNPRGLQTSLVYFSDWWRSIPADTMLLHAQNLKFKTRFVLQSTRRSCGAGGLVPAPVTRLGKSRSLSDFVSFRCVNRVCINKYMCEIRTTRTDKLLMLFMCFSLFCFVLFSFLSFLFVLVC